MPGHRRLIVSFMGMTDLKFWPVSEENPDDQSPLYRLLDYLFQRPSVPLDETKLLLFHEDGQKWTDLVKQIEADIEVLGWGAIGFEAIKLELPDGPTDLDALYAGTWDKIRNSVKRRTREEIFNITSGTPAMQACLILAADCLRLNKPRRFQMSRQKKVEEIQLPWAIAYRPRATPRGPKARNKLTDAARKGLLPNTVLGDPIVETELAALYNAATRAPNDAPVRVLLRGPTGSGKWTAARQFAAWRGGAVSEWHDPDHAPEVVENGSLLVHRLDAWTTDQMRMLGVLAKAREDIAIAATFRTDMGRAVLDLPRARENLPGVQQFTLPLPNERDDFIALASALAKKHGYKDGKLHERLGYPLYQGVPHGLTGLEALLTSAGSHGPGVHPDQTAVSDELAVLQAEDVLTECIERIAAANYSPERTLLDILADVEKAAVLLALQGGRAKSELETRIGIGRRKLTDIENRHWRLEKK